MSSDSNEAGMPASAAANQSKTESMPPTQAHADPDAAPGPTTVAVPDLDSMNVGATDPQSPSHRAAAAPPVPASRHVQTATSSDAAGAVYRAPGSLGTTGPDEQIDTDVQRSAQNTNVTGTPGAGSGPGDAAGVPVSSDDAAPGSSQASAVAQGSRTPV
ncbi:MAG: hypothetical protein JWO88_2182 [Frankiales bacterium]|nr:hypothetical protein [Frankiales bacterium]